MQLTIFAVFCLNVALGYSLPQPAVPKETAKDFSVHAIEKGNPVEEKVHVDPVNGIEVFYVPKHNELEEIYSVHDFNKNFSLRVYPNKRVCHVSKLEYDDLPKPNQLIKALEDHARTQERVKQTTMQDWLITGPAVQDRSFLHPKMSSYCPVFFPMFWITPMPELVTIEEDKSTITEHIPQTAHGRHKRVIVNCPVSKQRANCKMQLNACTYVRVCKNNYDQQVRNELVDCGMDHRYGRATCCKPCCLDKSKSDDTFYPHCASMPESEIVCNFSGARVNG